jgi:glycosyltransferase involved in cell wall biosynthesis
VQRSRPLRCAFVNHYVDWGGAEAMLLTLFDATDRTRLEPVLVVPREGRLTDGALALDVQIEFVPVSESVLEMTRGGASRFSGARTAAGLATTIGHLVKALRTLEIDVVVTNSAKAHVYGSIAAYLCRKPVVWRLHDTLDSPDFGASISRLMLRIAKRVPRRILSVSDSCSAPLLRDGFPKDRIVTLYNGIDLTPFLAVPPRIHDEAQAFVVGSFSRLTPLKGHDVAIRAIAQLVEAGHDARLVIAGGPSREAPGYGDFLVSLAHDLGVGDRLTLHEGFAQGGLPTIMTGVDVVVQASVLPDSLPTTIIEAMAGGRTVVASAIGGCPELLDNGDTGLLFEPGNIKELADCLASLRADPERTDRLGRAARESALRRFPVDVFAESFCRHVEEVADESGIKR